MPVLPLSTGGDISLIIIGMRLEKHPAPRPWLITSYIALPIMHIKVNKYIDLILLRLIDIFAVAEPIKAPTSSTVETSRFNGSLC